MPSPRRLPDSDFCQRAAKVAFANPFGAEFEALYPGIEAECGGQVQRLEAEGAAALRHYSGADRETMRIIFLFDAYQQYRAAFDTVIMHQGEAGDQPVVVAFARELIALLERRGFDLEEALRIFAIFFQIRRAYYFIQKGLVGSSSCMREFRRHLWDNVFTHDLRHYERSLWERMEDFSTLLLGETGAGKGAAAAAIGRSGFIPFDEKKQRFTESFTRGFLSINLSQFPEALLESELFGHRKGAFTGAVEAHEGVFARCSQFGAIFLDEIGEVPPPVQIKLLRVLQDRIFSPVGSHEVQRFKGRIIAATNRSLADLRGPGRFRDDFYYRLCSDVIVVPPLRQRLAEDSRELDVLLDNLVKRIAGDTAKELLPIVQTALKGLLKKNYAWPGNVRELEQAVRRILVTRDYSPENSAASDADQAAQLSDAFFAGALDADTLLARYCTLLYQRFQNLEEVARRTRLDRRTVKRYLKLG